MKKALVIITYNREEALKRVVESIEPSHFEKIVIVHDGGAGNGIPEDAIGHCKKGYSDEVVSVLEKNFTYLPQSENVGVGRCKILGLEYVLEHTDADHIFLMEDDVVIKDNAVWDYYIDFSSKSGIWHTNWNDYRYHGIKFEIEYDGIYGIITKDVEGAFSYFHRNMFKFCEFPKDMKNAFEHISVELQLIEKDLLPQFWNFACPKDSGEYLLHIGNSSTITNRPNYTENYQKALQAFIQRHGVSIDKIPDVPTEKVLERLKFLKENYAKDIDTKAE